MDKTDTENKALLQTMFIVLFTMQAQSSPYVHIYTHQITLTVQSMSDKSLGRINTNTSILLKVSVVEGSSVG